MRACWLILALIAISGCIGQAPITGNGIVIESFEPDFKTVYSGEIVNFNLKIRNTGSSVAAPVWAELLGVDQDFCCEVVGTGPWYKNEKLPNEPGCRYPGSAGAQPKQLLPPDPFWGTAGETMTCSWTYKIPQFPKGFYREYQPTVRIFYGYTTTLVQAINLLTREEMLDIERSGKPLPSQTVSITAGPLSIKAEMASPVRVFGNTVTFPIKLTINNIGGGVACLPGRCKKTVQGGEAWNRIKLSIKGVQLSDCQDSMEAELYQGQTTLTCQASLTDLRLTGPEQRQLTITAEYEYFIEQSTSITVKAEQI